MSSPTKRCCTCLGNRGNVGVMASEENDEPVVVERDRKHGNYVVVFDPLDGSSNIDVNVSVGTIFSILRREPDPTGQRDPLDDVLQPGRKQVAAGYVVYGSSTMLVYTTGNGVHGFTLDPSIGAFCISHENITMPDAGNDLLRQRSQRRQLSRGVSRLSGSLAVGQAGRTYSSRYIGSLVADFHRTLLKGGIFLYPPTEAVPPGQAAADVRSQPDRLSRRAGRRHGHRRQATDSRHPADGTASTDPSPGGEQEGDGLAEQDGGVEFSHRTKWLGRYWPPPS